MSARTERTTPASTLRARTIAAALLAPLACMVTAHTQTDTVYHLHGHVLNGETHRPVARALVTSADRRMATITDTNGSFALEVSVPLQDAAAGSQVRAMSPGLTLVASRPGFVPQDYGLQIELNARTVADDVTLTILPLATISGSVDADGIGPVSNVQVMLLHHEVSDGIAIWMPATVQVSAERGQFRFGDLEPGEYTVMTREWEGDAPAYLRESRQYPPRFAGGAATLTAAAKLQVRYGTDDQVRLHVREAAYFPVRIPVQMASPGTAVEVQVLADGSPLGYSLGWNSQESAVEGSLPAGSYTVLLTGSGPQMSFARVPISVSDTTAQHAPVTLVPAAAIPVRVRLDLTEDDSSNSVGIAFSGNPANMPSLASPVDVSLTSTEAGGRSFDDQRRSGTDPVLEGVAPGMYAVHARSIRGYVASITSGGLDLMRQPLVVGEGGSADPIDVTVRNDGGNLTGEVEMTADQSTRFVPVLLVAADGSGQSVQGYASNDGKLSVRNIPPGTYRAFASGQQQLQRLPYRDAAGMQAFEHQGALVNVAANQTVEVKLRYIPLLQPAGESK